MPTLLIAIVLLFAVGTIAVRRWRAWTVERRRPGASPANAIDAPRFDDIEEAVASQRCTCGGSFQIEGEGPLVDGDRRLRFVQLECRRCEKQRRVYFDVTLAFH